MWPRPHAIMFKNAKRFQSRVASAAAAARKLKLAKINKKQRLHKTGEPEPEPAKGGLQGKKHKFNSKRNIIMNALSEQQQQEQQQQQQHPTTTTST